jgi:hypothetical protein
MSERWHNNQKNKEVRLDGAGRKSGHEKMVQLKANQDRNRLG